MEIIEKTEVTEKITRHRAVSPHVKVKITQAAIENGIRKSSSHCMIAESIKAQIPTAKNVSVDMRTIRWTDPNKNLRYTYLTPEVAARHLVDWDEGVNPEPFEVGLRNAIHISRKKSRPSSSAARVGTSKDVVRAMADPEAPLGPPTAMFHSDDNPETSVPVVVGGKAGPVANFARVRRFGMRMLGRR